VAKKNSRPGVCEWAQLGTCTAIGSLAPQRSAGRGLGRGGSEQAGNRRFAHHLLSPALSSTAWKRGSLVRVSRCALTAKYPANPTLQNRPAHVTLTHVYV